MSVTEPEPFVESGVRYCENGRFAAKTIRRDQIEAAYWPELREGGVQMWHELKKP